MPPMPHTFHRLALTALAAWPALAGPRAPGPRPRILEKGYRVHFCDERGTLDISDKDRRSIHG